MRRRCRLAVAIIGAATLLLAGFSALTQPDIKRVLAYSTISQIGYMFLALGVGAWSAAIFHFMTHAFFKALLFLGAGVVIAELGDEHDHVQDGRAAARAAASRSGRSSSGRRSLAALPLVTAGFYSKDLILFEAWSSVLGGPWLWLAGLVGALLTSVYTFRDGVPDLLRRSAAATDRATGMASERAAGRAGGAGDHQRASSSCRSTLGDKPYFSTFMQSVLPAVVNLPGARH